MPRRICLSLVFILLVAACGGGDAATPTTEPAPTATAASTGAVGQGTGSTVSDGVCQVTIPDDWTDDGTARGRTLSGARWTLFGGRIRTDAAWTSAGDLLEQQQGNREGVAVERTEEQVILTQAENRGIVIRQRFDDRYCELSVTATASASDAEVQLWQSVARTLAPAGAG